MSNIIDRSLTAKHAELLSALGAGVLGGGVALLAGPWIKAFAIPLLALGIVTHGAGMTIKHRLETSRDSPLPLWQRFLYWFCWLMLAALAAWIGVRAVRGGLVAVA